MPSLGSCFSFPVAVISTSTPPAYLFHLCPFGHFTFHCPSHLAFHHSFNCPCIPLSLPPFCPPTPCTLQFLPTPSNICQLLLPVFNEDCSDWPLSPAASLRPRPGVLRQQWEEDGKGQLKQKSAGWPKGKT